MMDESFDFTKPAECSTWLQLVRAHAFGAIEAGQDLLRPPRRRRFSRAEATDRIVEGRRKLGFLLDAADKALPEWAFAASLGAGDPDRDPPSTARGGGR
jgi:hypothetical protein